MGGLSCAKEIIDNRNALVQKLDCMVASILLNASHTQPTEAMEDEFRDASNSLALVATKIERYVRTVSTTASPAGGDTLNG